ncbi:MAG TPA: hypothetical protein VNJ04_05465 [Gemmatimonadaceae bacterium]|nr:hypothetical protein [Gemmatimonadaceae bacterium]
MSVGLDSPREQPRPNDTPVWTLVKNGRTAQCLTRIDLTVDGVELRYLLDGEFRSSRLYVGRFLAELKTDAAAKRAELEAQGWISHGH